MICETVKGNCSDCLFFRRESNGLPCLEGLETKERLEVSGRVREAQDQTGEWCRRLEGSETVYKEKS